MFDNRAARFAGCARSWFISVAALSSVAVLAASTPQIASTWRSQEIRIDGVNTEWTAIDELEKGPGVAVANDDAFLYVIVTASDQQTRREIGSGVILWFDPTGAKKETFGIGIPGPLRHELVPGGGRSAQSPESVMPASLPAQPIDDFDVYGPEKNERHWIRMDAAFGIEMAAAMTEGTLVYELKLPLKKTEAHPYAVGAGLGAQLTFAVATPVVTPAPHAAGTGGGGGYGGGGGRGGGMGRGGGGGGRSGGMGGGQSPAASHTESIKIWTKLTLASPPASR
jgi:hypothetical protein